MIILKEQRAVPVLVILLLAVPAFLGAATPFVLCESSLQPVVKAVGLEGKYVSAVSEITEGSDVLIVGDIFSPPGNAPIFDLQQKKCRLVRIESPVISIFVSKIKAYMRYSASGKSVFDNPQEGMRYILYSSVESDIENHDAGISGSKGKTDDTGFQPRPIFNGPPATTPGFTTPLESRLATSGSANFDLKFGPNSAELPANAGQVLQELALLLEKDLGMVITVVGHTDYGQNTVAFNLELSKKRAANVKNWLVNRGIVESRISTMGLGDTRPLVVTDSRPLRPENRRIEITIPRKRP